MKRLALSILALLWTVGALAQPVQVMNIPQGSQTIPLTASTTGGAGSINVTLAGAAGKFTYVCGFVVTSGGTTTALIGNVTLAGTISGTMNFVYVFVSSGQGLMGVALPGCIQSSAINTSIVLTVPAGGVGTTVGASIWGYLN